jgi:hypothetical protein
MNSLAEQVAARDVASLFIYTHEAHPGENYQHLTSMEQKMSHAQDLRDKLGITRPILIDVLDGACHRAYGSMPNMSWIFRRNMLPVYKSDWTDANSLSNAIDYFLDVAERREKREPLAPFHVERLDYRNQDEEEFYQGLERNGPKAVEEFRKAF